MEFKYDPQNRRLIEGWNLIFYDTEDTIHLSMEEYEQLAFDFNWNGMIDCAFRTYHRGIEAGYKELIPLLGELYEQNDDLENTYRCYLEAALINDLNGIKNLSRMYKKGIYVQKDEKKSQKAKYVIKKNGRKKV